MRSIASSLSLKTFGYNYAHIEYNLEIVVGFHSFNSDLYDIIST